MKSSNIQDNFPGVASGSLDTDTIPRAEEMTIPSQPVENGSLAIPSHPLGVRPSGNQYSATRNFRHAIGFFQILPDEFILTLLEYLDARLLRSLGSTCKALFAFCASEDLWKALFIQNFPHGRHFTWRHTWRSTYLNLASDRVARPLCDHLFSDALYRPFLCAHTSLAPYTTNIPAKNQITRLKNITAEEFTATWCDKPFILMEPIREWPVYKEWDTTALLQTYGDVEFRQESVDWKLRAYVDYMNTTTDESPLYLFDRAFVEKMSLNVGQPTTSTPAPSYWIPPCFGLDLFSVLNDQRPDSRWLILGPARSGSTFHKDPNATSAWNAVLRGSKYWIMFPSNRDTPPPPGVYVSADQSEVTSPLSIAEWLLGFHAEARRTPGCIEGICAEGEVLHVPSGWWHLVVNLEASLAITQNFVPRAHLPEVLSFLKHKPDQVSGFKKHVEDPYALFVEGMSREYPDLLRKAEGEMQRREEGRKRKWDVVAAADGGEGGGGSFAFGFGGDGDSDEEIP